MKRQIMTVLALVGIVLLAGCKKQQAITPTTGTQITFTASTDGGEKTTLGDGGKVLWSLYDAIKVYNNAGGSGDFTLSNGEGETSATFSGKITGEAPYVAVYPSTAAAGFTSTTSISVSVPQTQNITSLSSFDANAALMVAETSGSTLGFKNVLGILRISLTGGETIDRIRVSSGEKYLCGTYNVNLTDMNNPTLGENPTADGSKYIDVVLNNPVSNPTINVMLPPGTYTDLCVTAYSSRGIVVSTTPVESKENITITRSCITNKSYTVAPAEFTINSSKGKVYFSKGNLYYSNSQWNFDANQYDVHTSSPAISGDTYYYIPWGEVVNNNTSNNPKLFTVSGTEGFRVMTNAEWEYVLRLYKGGGRNTDSDHLYAKANVCGIDGLIILPDNWNDDNESLSNYNDKKADFGGTNGNTIDFDKWTTLEGYGCVFLPIAGYSWGDGDPVQLPSLRGGYWSSTISNQLYFNVGGVNTGTGDITWGYSVRLVHPAE